MRRLLLYRPTGENMSQSERETDLKWTVSLGSETLFRPFSYLDNSLAIQDVNSFSPVLCPSVVVFSGKEGCFLWRASPRGPVERLSLRLPLPFASFKTYCQSFCLWQNRQSVFLPAVDYLWSFDNSSFFKLQCYCCGGLWPLTLFLTLTFKCVLLINYLLLPKTKKQFKAK